MGQYSAVASRWFSDTGLCTLDLLNVTDCRAWRDLCVSVSASQGSRFLVVHVLYAVYGSLFNVQANALFHSTTLLRAQEIRSTGRVASRRLSDRPHDGPLRRDDAPPSAFFTVSPDCTPIPSVVFHPPYAEPGESVASLMVPLQIFTQRLHQYRLFLVACAPTSARVRAPVRVTVLFARAPDAFWAKAQGLLELDIFSNPVLSCREQPEGSTSARNSWRMATRFFTPTTGWCKVKLVAAVANGLNLASVRAGAQWLSASRVFMVRFDFCFSAYVLCRVNLQLYICVNFSLIFRPITLPRRCVLWLYGRRDWL